MFLFLLVFKLDWGKWLEDVAPGSTVAGGEVKQGSSAELCYAMSWLCESCAAVVGDSHSSCLWGGWVRTIHLWGFGEMQGTWRRWVGWEEAASAPLKFNISFLAPLAFPLSILSCLWRLLGCLWVMWLFLDTCKTRYSLNAKCGFQAPCTFKYLRRIPDFLSTANCFNKQEGEAVVQGINLFIVGDELSKTN